MSEENKPTRDKEASTPRNEELNHQDQSDIDQKSEQPEAKPDGEQDPSGTEEEKEQEPVEMVQIPKSRLEELEEAEAVALEQVKRERAEAINYRKRLQKQRDEFAEIASARVLTKLLAVQDDIKRILENGREEIPKEHLEGIEMLDQRIKGIFESEGVNLIKIKEGKTRYDPNFHEAIVAQPVPNVAPNRIIQVISSGFTKGNRVLRPAKVIISKEIPKKTSEDKPESEKEESSEEMADQTVND